jgi:diguanylate cyclase (GGDEF)-like protein
MGNELDLLRRRLERERSARKQAEQIAEEVSRALFMKGQALEKALETEQATRKEIETLLSALETFSAALDPVEIARSLHRFLNQFISSHCTALYLLAESRIQVARVQNGLGESPAPPVVTEASAAIVWTPLGEPQRPRILEVGTGDERRVGIFAFQDETRAVMILPLTSPGRTVGYLTTENQEPGSYHEFQIRFALALANQASTALENARLFQEVERLSLTDPLTGLKNRRGFEGEARRSIEIAIRYRHPLSVLMVDVDFFKRVNDTYGHPMGDQVLVKVAQTCRQVSRLTDLLARLGGEEFCLLLPETTADNARHLAERLRAAISGNDFDAEGRRFAITVSIGISECASQDDTLETLLARSDEALYCAKQTGRNRVVSWDGRASLGAAPLTEEFPSQPDSA